MTTDTLKRFGTILKLYSEQFELIFKEDEKDQLINGLTFMEEYPLRMKQVVDNLLKFDD